MNPIKQRRLIIISIVLFLVVLSPISSLNTPPLHAQEPYIYYFPLMINNQQPLASNSYYMITIQGSLLYDLGCELGTRDRNLHGAQDSVAVLNFSYPICNEAENCYGADLYGFGPVPLEDIGEAIKHFALGYFNCTGSDNESNLVIGMGTNNKPTSCKTEAQAAAHGKAWGEMVNTINQWAEDKGIFHQVQVYGASNIELGWNTPTWSRAWVTGFEQAGPNFMLHFGDAAGCPYDDYPLWGCGTEKFPTWTQEDVWYVSYGAPSALPLPLIFLTNGANAKQWAYLSQYSVNQHGYRMDFTGVFTQSQACEQRVCIGTDNTPSEAYQQLYTELNKFPATAQSLRWKTDIRWILVDELSQSATSDDITLSGTSSHPIQQNITDLQADLQNAELSATSINNLEQKLNIYQSMALKIDLSKRNPALKDSRVSILSPTNSDPVFKIGMINGGEIPGLPYGFRINNSWQTITEHGYLQIAAGSIPGDSTEGVLYITHTALDKASSQFLFRLAPAGSGPLFIVNEMDNSLAIQSENGHSFIFDLHHLTLKIADR